MNPAVLASNILQRHNVGGGSSENAVFPSIDVSLLAGVGPAGGATKGYISFGGAQQFANGNEGQTWRVGGNHNGAADGDIKAYRYSGGAISAPTTIAADVASYNLTNPNFGIGNNNRAFVFWSKQRAANPSELTGPSDIFYKYSDDYYTIADPTAATWSAEIKMTTDFGELLTTSTTSVNLSTVTSPFSITVATGLLGVNIGRRVKIVSASDVNKNISGLVTAYNSGTGLLTMTIAVKNGTTTHADWNVGLSSYIDGPGEMIRLSNGDLIKPCWTTSGLGTSVNFYHSTAASNGLIWTALSSIVSGGDSLDETCIVQLANGNILAMIRANSVDFILQSTSTNLGATWSVPEVTNIPSEGKSPVAVSPQGIVCGITRDEPTNRTSFFYSATPSDATSWTFALLDNREGAYMYGSIFWSTTELKFIATYSVEGYNTTAFAGPTVVIRKELIQSATAVAPPTAWHVELQNVFDFAQANLETLPSDALKTKLNTFYNNMEAGSIDFLAEWDFMRVPLNDVTLEAIKNRDWKHPWNNNVVTTVNSPTFAPVGYAFNGTDQYARVSTATRLDQMVNYTRDDAGIYYYTPTNTQNDGRSFGLTSVQMIIRLNSDGNFYFRINDATYTTVTNAQNSGRFFIQRTSSTAKQAFRNGVSLVIGSVSSAAVSSGRLAIGALDGPLNFSNKIEGMLLIGSSLSGKEAEFDTIVANFLTSIGL